MPLEFKFPDVGEGIDGGELLQWHVAVGQAVREDDPLADVQIQPLHKRGIDLPAAWC